jgi:hypothetical protein
MIGALFGWKEAASSETPGGCAECRTHGARCWFGIGLAIAPLIFLPLAAVADPAIAEPPAKSSLLERGYGLFVAPIEELGALATRPMRRFSSEPAVCGPATAECKPAAVEVCRRLGYREGRPILTVTFKKCALPRPIGTGKCETLRRLDETVCW